MFHLLQKYSGILIFFREPILPNPYHAILAFTFFLSLFLFE